MNECQQYDSILIVMNIYRTNLNKI
jgi:hypothetical protein